MVAFRSVRFGLPRSGGGGVRRGLAMLVITALAATLVTAQPSSAASPSVPEPVAQKAASRPDMVSARVTAKAQGSRVEVESLRDATSTTWANPDGTTTTEQHSGPIRFRDDRGAWHDVDLTMTEAADGTVGPREHPTGLSLAGLTAAAGGAAKPADAAATTDLAMARQGKGKRKQERDVTVGWNGPLSSPVLSGTTATYRDVKSGVDLVVDARRTGYELHLVINTPQALAALRHAAGGKPLSWQVPVRLRGLTARADGDGGVSFIDADGQVTSFLAPPVAWDDQVDRQSGNRVNESPVRMTVAQQGAGRAVLTLTPDQDWLASPQRKFPVTIDPTYASGGNVATTFDTYVSSAYSSASYSTDTELRVGTYNGGGDKYRSFLTFPLASFKGKDITSASLSLYEFHSWSCTAKPFYVYSASAATSSTNWSNQPSAPTSYGSLSVAKGYSSSCAAGRVSVPVTSLAAAWSGSSSSTGSIRLHASETDNLGWKKFYSVESSQDPYMTFSYNRKPNVASTPSVAASQSNTYTAPGSSTPMLFTSVATPTLTTTITDPDGNTVYSNIEVHSSTTGSNLVTECNTATVASGATASCTLPVALTDSRTYYVRAAAADERGLWNGTWSPWRTLYVSLSTPPAPVISCPGFTSGQWQDSPPATDEVCTITAAGVSGNYMTPGYIDLTVDTAATKRVPITPSNDPNVAKTTVTIARVPGGGHVIRAVAISRSLKSSAASTFSLGWGGASLLLPTVGTASSGKIAMTAEGPPRGGSATVSGKVQWRVAGSGNESTGWTDGPAVPVTNASGAMPGANDPVKVASSFTLSSAVREAGASADLNPRVPVLLDLQVCFTYSGVASPQCTWSQTQRSVTRIPHAFGAGFPTAVAGPGQVALFTGEFNTSATDVTVPGYSGDLALSRSHLSFDGDGTVANWPSDPVTGVFGPGWTASLEGPETGTAGLQVIDNTRTDGTIVLVDAGGEPLVYQTPSKNRAYQVTATGAAKVAYLPATTDTTATAADLVITNTTAIPAASMTMSLTEEDGTVTTWAPVAYSATADTDWIPVSVNEPGQVGATTYGHDATGRVTRIVAAVPPNGAAPPAAAVTCPTSGTLVKGCRGLDISYATATTATSTAPGDYTGRVEAVSAVLWDPAISTMATTTVATYKYDTSGRLVNVTDPRTGLGTDYTWDGTSTRLGSVKATGLAAYRLSYDATPGSPRVATVTRDNPAGTGAAVTLSRYNYAVPLSGAGLPDLTSDAGSDQVRLWNQASNPVTGYAVFDADYTGAVSGTGVDWSRADLQYADDQGYTVDTARYGAGAWQVSATDYDARGNIIRALGARATATVRDAAVAGSPLDPAQVDAQSTQTIYNSDITGTVDEDGAGPGAAATKVVTEAGTLVTDTYGPTRSAALATDLGGDGVIDVLPVRPHTHTSYDQGAPATAYGAGINPATVEPFRLPTTITTGVADSGAAIGAADLETTSTTVNSYAKLVSADGTEGDPWTLGSPSKVTTGGITHITRYDTEGRTTQTQQPLSSGSDAGTTQTIYYTAYANAADAACENKVEWAGLACRTLPVAAPSAGAGGAGSLPDSRTTAYNAWLQPLTEVETSGAVTRTTQTEYDGAGRTTKTWTAVSGLSGSTARPGTFTHYRAADGLVDYTGDLNAAKTDADPVARVSTTYDAWGRTLTSTNDLGDTATTTYVAPGTPGAGSVATVVDAKGTTSYKYDGDGDPNGKDAAGNAEHRGLITYQAVTRPGTGGTLTFTAAYDADANMTVQKLPGRVTQTTNYDEAGEPVGLTYSGTVQPVKPRTELDENGDPVGVTDAFGNPVYDPDGPALADQPWLAWTVVNDAQGRVRSELTGPSAGFDGNPGVADPADITGYDTGRGIGYDRSYSYDGAGRLVGVVDHTAAVHGADLAASPCQVRTYAFDANGRRTSLASATHPDGVCDGATGVTSTSASFNYYDTADRPTRGRGGIGQYVYDALGRQTVIPAVDTPAYAADSTAGDITLGYFDDDLPRSVVQTVAGQQTSTVFSLDSAGHRSTATTTTGSATSTLVRHYTDASDNPAWTVATDSLGQVTTTRYAESIGGDLGASIGTDGYVTLTLADPHGDVVTTVPIGAAAASGAAAAGIAGWSDFTEYGTARAESTTAVTGGVVGYGWLGAKQRSTTTETAGLTLMGDRLYNSVTGRFTSLDPEPGGNDTAYSYPADPLNQFDLDGHRWGWRKIFRTVAAVASVASFVPGPIGMIASGIAVAGYAAGGCWRCAAGAALGFVPGGRLVGRVLSGSGRFARAGRAAVTWQARNRYIGARSRAFGFRSRWNRVMSHGRVRLGWSRSSGGRVAWRMGGGGRHNHWFVHRSNARFNEFL